MLDPNETLKPVFQEIKIKNKVSKQPNNNPQYKCMIYSCILGACNPLKKSATFSNMP